MDSTDHRQGPAPQGAGPFSTFPADTALKVALAPLLLAQGLGVRRRALILPEAPGPRSGSTGDGPPLRLLLVGDSSAAGVGAPSQQAALSGRLAGLLGQQYRLDWKLIARTGATTADILERLRAQPPARFDIAITALGVNDITHGVPLSRWLARLAMLRQLLRDRFGVARFVHSGLPPMGAFPALPQPLRAALGMTARRYDRALGRAVSALGNTTHVPFDLPLTADLMAPDGFHPGPTGYALWARLLAPSVVAAASALPPSGKLPSDALPTTP